MCGLVSWSGVDTLFKAKTNAVNNLDEVNVERLPLQFNLPLHMWSVCKQNASLQFHIWPHLLPDVVSDSQQWDEYIIVQKLVISVAFADLQNYCYIHRHRPRPCDLQYVQCSLIMDYTKYSMLWTQCQLSNQNTSMLSLRNVMIKFIDVRLV